MPSIWKPRPAGRDARTGHPDADGLAALQEEVTALRADLDGMRARLYALHLLLGPDGRNKSRIPTLSQMKDISAQVAGVTGLPDPYSQVVLAYRTLVELELRGVGRIAGGLANILGKLSTTPLLAPPNGSVLEIGTLYGLFAGGLARQLARSGLEYDLTIVDPLADHQLQSGWNQQADPSASPVSEAVARANLSLAGVDPARLRLHAGYSEDPEVRSALSDREYGVIVVDGDHSAEGVGRDLEWAEKIGARAAILVVDDYGDRNWPGVTQALDDHLAGHTSFEFLGTVSTTAYLRRA